MSCSTFLSLALLLAGSASAAWVSVPLPSGAWVAVKEVVPGRRFLLHPQARILRATFAPDCSATATTLIQVRLWYPQALRLTKTVLQRQQVCRLVGPCRVEPYQARFVVLRDRQGLWKLLQPRRIVPVVLPPTMQFSLVRNTSTKCQPLSSRALSGLVVEIGGSARSQEYDVIMEVDASRLTDRNGSQLTEPKPEATVQKATAEETRLRSEVKRLRAELEARGQMDVKGKQKPQRPLAALKKTASGVPIVSDCLDVKLRGLKKGYYFWEVGNREVLCLVTGEMVVVRRTNNSTNFSGDWAYYRNGFGDVRTTDFFVGLSLMNNYTAAGLRCMGLYLRSKNVSLPIVTAKYANFVIAPETKKFKLTYETYSGTLTQNALSYHNGLTFQTISSCAKERNAGFWYNYCDSINLFAPFHSKYFNSLGFSKEKPKAEYPLGSAFMTLRNLDGDPSAIKTLVLTEATACPPRLQEWTAPYTAKFLITASGAAGGTSGHVTSPRGGRGAVVRIKVVLQRGTKLRYAVGCAGRTGHFSGAGGDGTFVADHSRRKLLLAAGGGGGAGWTAGGDGRAVAAGEKAHLAPGLPGNILEYAAVGWSSLRRKFFKALRGALAASGGATASNNHNSKRGGGGGGGFGGGWGAADGRLDGDREDPRHSAGGGGGSACGSELVESCEVEEGGNRKANGSLTIEAYRCF